MQTKERTPHEIIVGMVDHFIEKRINHSPYIGIISKKQIWYGNGIWKDCPDDEIKAGLRSFLRIKIPSKQQVEEKNLFYGYPALQMPWQFLNNITNNAIRNGVTKETLDGKHKDIRIIFGRGYVREDGTLDPTQTSGVSCYVFFASDPKNRDEQNDWIRNQKDWVQLQIFRNITTHHQILSVKKKQASAIVKLNQALLMQSEYKELVVPIDREKITWDDDE